MKTKKEDLTLEYLNKRIDRVNKRFRTLQDIVYKWKQEDAIRIDNLEKDLNTLKNTNICQNSSNGQIALPKSIAKANEQPLAKGESVGSNPTSDAIILLEKAILLDLIRNSLGFTKDDIINFSNKRFK